jgi:thioredoxin-related protein
MLKLFTILFFSFIVSLNASAANETELAAGLVNPGYVEKPAWFKTSFLDLYEDIDEAADSGKRVMLYFYQDGCPYCKKLVQDNFGQRAIAEKTQRYFDVVAINIWGDREVTIGDKVITEKQFAEALKVQYTPTLLFFNKDRKTIFRANGYYPPAKFTALLDYIGQKQEKALSYQAYMQKVEPQPATGKLHTDVTSVKNTSDLQAALSKGKHLLEMFEQKQCLACDELHLDILQRPASKQQLARLNVAVVDMWSQQNIKRPDGKTSSVQQWTKDLGINYAPSLVYFNDRGEEVFRADAYLKAFHTQSVMDYVASFAYQQQTNFQRYIDKRADRLRKQGIEVDLMR